MSIENIIRLNVGRAQFQTSKSTLTRFDGFFKTMLETNVPITKDESGAIFIDRSAKHFELILNYMRDGDVEIPKTSEDVKDLQKEAQYYLLDGLVKLCELQKPPKNWIRHLQNWQEETNAIMNSRKQAVIFVNYDNRSSLISMEIAKVMLKYEEVLDVFFKEMCSYGDTTCTVYDKTKNENFYCQFKYFEENFKTKCAHLL